MLNPNSRRWLVVLSVATLLVALPTAAVGHDGHITVPPTGVGDELPSAASRADVEVPRTVSDVAAATPPARCGSGSRPESGRQGRVPLVDHQNGRAAEGYFCNARQLGHTGQGGGFQVHRYIDSAGRECAYYDSTLIYGRDLPRGEEPGVYALDMSDAARPVRTAVLRTPAMQSPHESLRLSAERGLLVATMGSPVTQVGVMDIYDVSSDCRNPVLRSSTPFGGLGHEGGLSPDGRTYWATTTFAEGITAIDISEPVSPKVLWRNFDYAVHGIALSADGTRAYLARVHVKVTDPVAYVPHERWAGGGLVILDVSDIQARSANPVVREVGRLSWPEISIPQNSIPVEIQGRSYLIQFDEFDSNTWSEDPGDLVGAVRIVDIEDEASPHIVSRIRLEVHQQEARATDQGDDPGEAPGQGYAAHYCAVPRLVDPTIVACTMILSGLRVFDISDPETPREVAYFNRPMGATSDESTVVGAYAMAAPAFAPERAEVWYSDANTGFFTVRLTGEAAALLESTTSPPTPAGVGSDVPEATPQPDARLPATGPPTEWLFGVAMAVLVACLVSHRLLAATSTSSVVSPRSSERTPEGTA